MGAWDSPPTEDEIRAAAGEPGPFDTPPTEAEGGAPPSYGFAYPDPATVAPEEKERIVSKGRNVPATWLTDDPATNRQMGENAWQQGATRPTTTGDAVRASGLVLGGLTGAVPGVIPAAVGGGLTAAGMSDKDSGAGVTWDAVKGAVLSASLAKAIPWALTKAGEKIPAVGRVLDRLGNWIEGPQAAPSAPAEPLPSVAALDNAAKAPPPSLPQASAPAPVQAPPQAGIASQIVGRNAVTPEAQYLIDRGVPLTEGLRDSASQLGQREIAMQSSPVGGSIIRGQRAAALRSAMDLGFKEAAPPGAPAVKLGGGIHDKFLKLEEMWNSAYDKVRAAAGKVYPAIHDGRGGVPLLGTPENPGAIGQALRDPDLLGSAEEIARVERFVDNQFTKLQLNPGAIRAVDASDMLDIRSVIRAKARDAMRAENWERFELLRAAEQKITEAVQSQIPPEVAAELAKLDSRYPTFLVMDYATRAAKDSPAGITPAVLQNSIVKVAGNTRDYARGGGPLRDLSKAIRTVFDESAVPPTGVRPMVAGLISEGTKFDKYIGTPGVALRNARLAKPPATQVPASRQTVEVPGIGPAYPPLRQVDFADLSEFLRRYVGQASAQAEDR